MLINEIARKTGISKKAIYIYENKGLLKVGRLENGYRIYSEEDENRLNKIKLLRCAGISVADIKLLFDDVVTIEELTGKRRKEIEREYGSCSEQLNLCSMLINRYKTNDYNKISEFNETDISETLNTGMSDDILSLGIDVGTTTISAAIIDLTTQRQAETYTLENNCRINSEEDFSEQDAEKILNKVKKLLEHIFKHYPNIASIGITGQMHGILYIDKKGNAVSNFITWQDKRAKRICENGIDYCDKIYKISGEKVSAGFGFATHYYNTCNGLVPENAYTFCNITDYIVMKLSGIVFPVIHNSVSASFGLFDIKKSCFKAEKISELGMNNITMPVVTEDFLVCGKYGNAAVSVGIGDNQAAFLGSVEDLDESILVNIGTGSQISTVWDTDEIICGGTELRPLIKGKYILCGSALCGGEAYALTEKFFRGFSMQLNGSDSPVYEAMNKLAEKAYSEHKQPLEVNTAFCGTRLNPAECAGVFGITDLNFTAGQFILGVIFGICSELYNFFGDKVKKKKNCDCVRKCRSEKCCI